MKNIMVIFGGRSVEHDISIITALQVMRIAKSEEKIVPVYVDKSGKWWTGDKFDEVDTFINFNPKKSKQVSFIAGENVLFVKKGKNLKPLCKIDGAVMCLHGGEGEDGSIAAVLSICDVPFTSSGHTSSAICMDKIFTKDVLCSNQISNVPFVYFSNEKFYDDPKSVLKKIKELGYPVIIKPANLGSSVAIEIAQNEKEVADKIEIACAFDKRILVEKFLEKCEEFNCACIKVDGEVVTSKVLQVSKKQIFSFEEKYIQENRPEKTVFASKGVKNKIKKMAQEVYEVLDCEGVVRIDFLVKNDEIYVNEVNTIPGALSMYMFDEFANREIIEKLLANAEKKAAKKKSLLLDFRSEALLVFKNTMKNMKK